MAKIPTRDSFHVELGSIAGQHYYFKHLTGWRYWWAKLRGKPTTVPAPMHIQTIQTPIGVVVEGPNGEKLLKLMLGRDDE